MTEENGKPRGASSFITADDVAVAAGVSRWTVNRAFKKQASISPGTREKVMSAATKLGYVPDLMAASLASARSNLVALLVDDFANPHKLVMMERLTRALRRRGWDTLLVNTINREDAGHALLGASQRRVDAAILIGIQFDDEVLDAALHARRFRKLIIFARMSQNPNTISIAVDDVRAMTEIAEYVHRRGYRRPMFLAGPRTHSAHLERKETFEAYWQRLFGTTPENIAVAAYDPVLAAEVLERSLAGRSREALPDIVVCENDALAMGAVDVIRHSLNLRIPDDIAVTGFDDVPQASGPNYRLTTYRQPLTEMSEYLVDVLESDVHNGLSRAFHGALVERDSA
ncbi:LacI family transcriptional regulator [Sinirhodobacter populi]|uniref:LacI family transcriptional regulator n=1 Tax=Paenirhodobacter populi TaxID=2306993 RepID=A0A443IK80_9RHOB|nr:LacI family DNA-binding transcriptional regulator [Sinirhodobacter populi]RWR05057.1 LacI family transcriptional regulator [Sinirhodobacter populi]RWR27636.1 LacI family transcriptional regulator [Sinirhodobacter populi]